ncbi:hypothetical protein FB645_006093 [Coemansia sp. IMI 203386]|nr:hypothetical protein FB645_006093 [Coemansia sp. IMI 203386]
MSKFVPFGGKGLIHFNHVDSGYQCNFCGKVLASFALYEGHWPKCTGICKERVLRPFDMPLYPCFTSALGGHQCAKESKDSKDSKDSRGSKQSKPAAANNTGNAAKAAASKSKKPATPAAPAAAKKASGGKKK